MRKFQLVFYLTVSSLLILSCLTPTIESQEDLADCQTWTARCNLCRRSLFEGPDEENLAGALNRKCRRRVGRTYVWRDVRRCEMVDIQCRGLNQTLSCENIAILANMQRRLA